LFGQRRTRETLRPLYDAAVALARDPAWYREGGVADTLEGRFAMVAAVTALILLRLEAEGEAGRRDSVLLTEIFIADMDATLRQLGIGDYVVGKHVGRMMSALGGRLAAFRAGREAGALGEAVTRNVFHEAPPSTEAVAFVADGLERFAAALDSTPIAGVLGGHLP
jgi:cytochrome b pre-mRNA-processing protein 3